LLKHIRDISTLTDRDYIEIISTFTTLTEPKYRCDDCKFKHKGDKFTKQQTFMACNYVAKSHRHKYLASHNNQGNPSVKYFNCIGNHYYGGWANIINFLPDYEKGIMPFTGGLMEQPSKFVEVMNLVHNLVSENDTEKARRKELATKGRSGRK